MSHIAPFRTRWSFFRSGKRLSNAWSLRSMPRVSAIGMLLAGLGGTACNDTSAARLSLPDGSELFGGSGGGGGAQTAGASMATGGATQPARDPMMAPQACAVSTNDFVVTSFSAPDGTTPVPVSFVFVADCHGTTTPELPCTDPTSVGVIVDIPPAIDPYAGCSAFHVSGQGQQTFAALIGNMNSEWSTDLNKNVFTPTDLSAYTGLRFWARGSGNLFVSVPTVDTADDTAGGTCKPQGMVNCGDSFGTAQTLGLDWKEYRIPFKMMKQGSWGVPAPAPSIDATRALAVSFNFVPPTPISFDLAVTAVVFYKD